MFDVHYDLLSRLYYDYVKYDKVTDSTKSDLRMIFNNNNIIGNISNLYFMSESEMFDEIGLNLNQLSDVNSIFRKCLELLKELIDERVIPKNTKFIYSIEGCDFIDSVKQLEELYNSGLRSILLVWNNSNKYGSGNRGAYGLTTLGKNFIKKAIELGIIIDVSHANEKTFNDILDIVEQSDNSPILIASHSNSRDLMNVPRNLSYNQLLRLKKLGGYIGIVGYNPFVSNNDFKNFYLKHIDYMINVVKFPIDKILISTDNMNFLESYESTFDIHNIIELRNLLLQKYSKDIVDKIMFKNATDIYNKVKKTV